MYVSDLYIYINKGQIYKYKDFYMNTVMKWVWLNGRFAFCHAHLKDIHSIVSVTVHTPTLRPSSATPTLITPIFANNHIYIPGSIFINVRGVHKGHLCPLFPRIDRIIYDFLPCAYQH